MQWWEGSNNLAFILPLVGMQTVKAFLEADWKYLTKACGKIPILCARQAPSPPDPLSTLLHPVLCPGRWTPRVTATGHVPASQPDSSEEAGEETMTGFLAEDGRRRGQVFPPLVSPLLGHCSCQDHLLSTTLCPSWFLSSIPLSVPLGVGPLSALLPRVLDSSVVGLSPAHTFLSS